jgi:precorrin-2/cobalt-factor-2 C20-methyltransferase
LSGREKIGRLIGVGTGPGDPELLTLKAVKALSQADVLAHFAKRGNAGNARAIIQAHARQDWIELPLLYPVTTEIDKNDDAYKDQILGFYEESAQAVARHLDAGRTVAVLSEGDPLFYGSYMHLHVRLAHRFPTEIIPGVTAMSGCWSQAGLPLVQGDDVLTVLPGTMAEAELTRRLSDTDAAVIMKVGRNLPKIRRALHVAGKLGNAVYVERGTMANTATIPLAEKTEDTAPYFSIVLAPGWSAKPGRSTPSQSPAKALDPAT